jgi:hypothetical protein
VVFGAGRGLAKSIVWKGRMCGVERVLKEGDIVTLTQSCWKGWGGHPLGTGIG